ncbi:alpha-L-fucosidase 1, partial [Amborella trichopoda]|uniref:alpha-L-fucosidase 1 n=1 Tax=Amborella trichopoda TaxID=13333 RepID=UPI0005D401AF
FQVSNSHPLPPPLPLLPLPNSAQLKWQQRELIMFMHFGMNTFTDSEWGTGHESPTTFAPTSLDTSQWARVAKDSGFSLVILTAKHHDGFCLWPSKYTDHSVKFSPWKNGTGDVVHDFVDSARAQGLDVGLYLSPWDRHEHTYGRDLPYNEFYLGQLQELLRRYGSISEIWFDGAKGADAANMTYFFKDWFSMVKELQGSINIFSDAGPNVRWVGDEAGFAGSTCWSTINQSLVTIGTSNVGYLNSGDPHGHNWVPPECDVSLRKGWFWHKSQGPKPLNQLLDIYYKSVGRNCVMLLNVPPNSSGLISEPDIQTLAQLKYAIKTIFQQNLAQQANIKASSQRGGKQGGFEPYNVLDDDIWSYWAPDGSKRPTAEGHWIELKGGKEGFRFNVVRIQEAVGLGQRVKRYEVYARWGGKSWVLANGTTIGYKRLHKLDQVVQARWVRVHILEARGLPLIASIGLHHDPL